MYKARAVQDDVPQCESCPIRAKAEARPKSFIGFIWRLHTKICPGWKKYQRWLAEKEAGQKAVKNFYVVSLLI